MDDLSAIATEAIRVLLAAGAPFYVLAAAVILVALLRVYGPRVNLPEIKVEPSPVVDEGGVQQPGTSLEPAPGDEGGYVLPTDPDREDLNSGGG